jgi:hypothetical protein
MGLAVIAFTAATLLFIKGSNSEEQPKPKRNESKPKAYEFRLNDYYKHYIRR